MASLLLGGVILLASLANSLFGIIRSIDYLRTNTPHFFAFITSPTAEIGIPIFGLVLVSIGLYEIWTIKRHNLPELHSQARNTDLVIDFDQAIDIQSVDGGEQIHGNLRLRNSGQKSLTDVTLKIAAIDVLTVIRDENEHRIDVQATAEGLIDAPLMMIRDEERPRLKSLPLLHSGDTVEFYIVNVARKGFLNIVHAISQAVHVPSQGTQYINGRACSFPPGRYRIRVKAQARDVETKYFTYMVDFNLTTVTIEADGGISVSITGTLRRHGP